MPENKGALKIILIAVFIVVLLVGVKVFSKLSGNMYGHRNNTNQMENNMYTLEGAKANIQNSGEKISELRVVFEEETSSDEEVALVFAQAQEALNKSIASVNGLGEESDEYNQLMADVQIQLNEFSTIAQELGYEDSPEEDL